MAMSPEGLWATFLEQAFPSGPNPAMEQVSAAEAVKVFYDAAAPFLQHAQTSGRKWRPSAIAEVDEALEGIARAGDTRRVIHLSPEGACEWWMRWSYAITALTLQKEAQAEWHVWVPRHAAEDIRHTALVLFVMAGPARDYPPQLLERFQQGR